MWLEAVGLSSPPDYWPLVEWVHDLRQRYEFLNLVLSKGLDGLPGYWLGAFFRPKAFLSVVKEVGGAGGCGSLLMQVMF